MLYEEKIIETIQMCIRDRQRLVAKASVLCCFLPPFMRK